MIRLEDLLSIQPQQQPAAGQSSPRDIQRLLRMLAQSEAQGNYGRENNGLLSAPQPIQVQSVLRQLPAGGPFGNQDGNNFPVNDLPVQIRQPAPRIPLSPYADPPPAFHRGNLAAPPVLPEEQSPAVAVTPSASRVPLSPYAGPAPTFHPASPANAAPTTLLESLLYGDRTGQDRATREEAGAARTEERANAYRDRFRQALETNGMSPEEATALVNQANPAPARPEVPAQTEALATSPTTPAPAPPSARQEAPSVTPEDPIDAALRQILAGQGQGAGGGGQGVPAGTGNPAVPRQSLANILRPDMAGILQQYDRAAPPQGEMNTDEQYLMGLLGGIAGIRFQPGQRLGFGLQGAAGGAVEGYGNERSRQRADIRQDAREGRQHQAGRASLEAQLAGQDYERQVGSARFDQSERFHQDQQQTARAGLAASQANAAATRQMQGLGLMLRLQALRQSGAAQNLDLDAGSMAATIVPRLSGAAGASRRLALPGGLGVQFGAGLENSNLPISEVENRAGRLFDESLRNNPELRTRVLMAGANDTTRRDFIQRQVENAIMGTLGNLSQRATEDPAAQQQLSNWLNFMRRTTIVSRSQRQPTQNPDLDSLN
jgi:hypothetical protein